METDQLITDHSVKEKNVKEIKFFLKTRNSEDPTFQNIRNMAKAHLETRWSAIK